VNEIYSGTIEKHRAAILIEEVVEDFYQYRMGHGT